MKYATALFMLMFCAGCASRHYSVWKDNSDCDYAREGIIRIVDNETGKIGYADPNGEILIEPRYAYGFPFENGKAKVTYTGMKNMIRDSFGEYHYWDSRDWLYVDREGNEMKEE